ncbi:MAG TPA: hypothetical protein VGO55_12495 [Allosphingosinicella sp.]|jgi:hypothetical protein|nr:hypothetical protein [Allosphingosinicella sp.]
MERTARIGIGAAVAGHAALLVLMWFIVIRGNSELALPPAMEVSYVDEVGPTSTSPNPMPAAAPPAAQEQGPVELAAPSPEAGPAPAAAPSPAAAPARQTGGQRDARGSGEVSRSPGLNLNPNSFGDDPQRAPGAPAANYGPGQLRSLRGAIGAALDYCRRQPLPAREAVDIHVDYRVTLNRDGTVASAQLIRVTNNDPSLERYETRMRDLARNVLTQCQERVRRAVLQYPGWDEAPANWRQFTYQFPRTN